MAAVLARARAWTQLAAASRWATLESAELDTFRRNAPGRLAADLEAVLFSPAADRGAAGTRRVPHQPGPRSRIPPVAAWLAASGTRIDGLRAAGERGGRATWPRTAAQDLQAARAGGIRDLGLSLAVLVLVAALALALRRSITRPLREVSAGARTLSSGDLTFDVSYAGRDEIGDVAAAFRDLRVTAERLAGEIRATTAAISDNRLDHRADVAPSTGPGLSCSPA